VWREAVCKLKWWFVRACTHTPHKHAPALEILVSTILEQSLDDTKISFGTRHMQHGALIIIGAIDISASPDEPTHLCCSVLQCVAVCCSVLHCVAACCSVLQCVAVCCSVLQYVAMLYSVLQCWCCRYERLFGRCTWQCPMKNYRVACLPWILSHAFMSRVSHILESRNH